VDVQIERRPKPLNDGHRSATPIRHALPLASPSSQEAEHRPHEHPDHRAAQRVIPGQQVPHPAQIAYSGWSCGGLQALQVAKDPRVKMLVIHNSGVLNDGPSTIPGMDVGKEVLQTLHTPVIYILGGPTDIAYPNGTDDFKRVAHVPIAMASLPVGHGGTFNEPNGGAAASVAVSWLDWQLRGDAGSARLFVGEDCGLCHDTRWSLQRKQFPATRASR
jgi:hypothetical protein